MVSLIDEHISDAVIYQKLYLIPSISQPLRRYPLSYQYFMQTYYRLMNRNSHETLDNQDPILTLQVLFMFFNLNIDTRFNFDFLQSYGLSEYLKIPLTSDDNLLVVPKVLEDTISQILNTIKKNDKPKDLQLL